MIGTTPQPPQKPVHLGGGEPARATRNDSIAFVSPFDRLPPWAFLVLACVTATFTSFMAVPIFAVSWPCFFLMYSCAIDRLSWKLPAGALCVTTFFSIGGATYFKDGRSFAASYFATFGFGIAILLLTYCIPALVQVFVWRRAPNLELSSLAFPTLLTGLWQLWYRFGPTGAAGSPAMALAFQPELRQLTAIFGEISLVFVIGWIASVGAGLLINRVSKRHLLVFLSCGVAVLFYGGVRFGSGRGMWLQDIADWPQAAKPVAEKQPLNFEHPFGGDKLRVACIVPSDDASFDDIAGAANAALASAADIVIFSETSAYAPKVLSPHINFAQAPAAFPYIVTTFVDSKMSVAEYNTISLFNGSGTWDTYAKNRPVPILESDITASNKRTHPVRLTFGEKGQINLNVGLSICFDFDFPYLFKDSYGVDLMLGASNYWSSIGWALWGDNIFRAIENGWTLYKCSRNGMSGAADPYGRELASKPTTTDEIYMTEIPVQRHVWTAYRNAGGWLFGWICLGFIPFYCALAYWGKQAEEKCPAWLKRNASGEEAAVAKQAAVVP